MASMTAGDERARDVADAHLDELRLGVRLGVRGGTAGDLGEQIAAGKFLVIRVDLSHEGASLHVSVSASGGATATAAVFIRAHFAADFPEISEM